MNRYKEMIGKSREIGEYMDCGIIAVAISAGVNYEDSYAGFELMGRKPKKRVSREWIFSVLDMLGYAPMKIQVPMIKRKNGKQIKPMVKEIGQVLTEGTYLVFTRGHVFALVNGQVEDWTRDRRNRVREVWRVEK